MELPEVVSREKWLQARTQLLKQEKDLTRRRDALAAERRRLPMVRVGQEYTFTGPDGPVTLAGLFGGARQLVVHHVMFGPDWDEPCPVCTAFMDGLTPVTFGRMRARDTAFVLISRAPAAAIAAAQARHGWSLPWYSSDGISFNYDFGVTMDPAVRPPEYNYRPEPGLGGGEPSCELPGASCFLRDGAEIFHTYSAYARGLDHTDQVNAYLDLTAFGRSEAWEEPKGRAPALY
jgi:predicted dithiol-disulfide oxidoreductase (DUF899 family)